MAGGAMVGYANNANAGKTKPIHGKPKVSSFSCCVAYKNLVSLKDISRLTTQSRFKFAKKRDANSAVHD